VAVKSLLTDITHAVVSYQRIKNVGLLVPNTVFFSQKFTRDNLSGFVLNSLASITIIMAIEKSEHAEMRWRHTFHHKPFYQVNLSLKVHDILSNEVV
jgi:hypothetical protein